ncbi:MAG: hypothetical protein ABWZ25_08155 [Chitinophagaceae bacterium]
MTSSANSFWNSLYGQFVIELIGGTIGALIFLFIVLILFRPNVKICPFICFNQLKGANTIYYFKLVNFSFFPAHDVEIELFSVRKISMGRGLFNNKYEPIPLLLSKISHMPGRAMCFRKSPQNPHCFVIRCGDDLKSILKVDINAIALKISLKHGLTGLARVVEQEFGNVEDLKAGKFKPGTKFDLI